MEQKKERQVVIVVGLVVKDNKILLVRRDESGRPEVHGKWEFPGGKIEFSETPEEAVIREVKEEAGVKVKVKKLLDCTVTAYWEYPSINQHTLIFGYECEFVKKLPNNQDHRVMEVEWVDIHKVLDRENLPGAEEFLKALVA